MSHLIDQSHLYLHIAHYGRGFGIKNEHLFLSTKLPLKVRLSPKQGVTSWLFSCLLHKHIEDMDGHTNYRIMGLYYYKHGLLYKSLDYGRILVFHTHKQPLWREVFDCLHLFQLFWCGLAIMRFNLRDMGLPKSLHAKYELSQWPISFIHLFIYYMIW